MAGDAEKQHECFIVGVIGKPDTEQRVHADWFIDGIVTPVFKEHFKDFKVIRADRMNTPGIITSQIIDKLLTARLVIADMTFLNANAFYEIGIRHMTGLPIIHAHREGEGIPFDVSTFLSMSYSLAQFQHIEKAKDALKTLVENVLAEGYTVENPVTQARGRAKFNETATDPDKLLLGQIERISSRLALLEQRDSSAAFFHPSSRAPKSLIGGATINYGGGEPLPPYEASFSPQQGVPPAAVRQFLEEHVLSRIPQTVVVRHSKSSGTVTIHYSEGEITTDQLEEWSNLGANRGVDVIPF